MVLAALEVVANGDRSNSSSGNSSSSSSAGCYSSSRQERITALDIIIILTNCLGYVFRCLEETKHMRKTGRG